MPKNRDSKVSFSEVEEEFFRAGSNRAATEPGVEDFSDLDEGYKPVSIWQRMFGKKPR
jgi:hypothetical protein